MSVTQDGPQQREQATSDLLMVDQAFPPQQVSADVCLVYSGGDTPHTWSKAEVDAQPARYRLPTYVRSNPSAVSASTDASDFLSWLSGAGCPKGSSVVIDLETAVDTAYVNAFNTALTDAGYPVIKYGSLGFIFGNPKTSGGTFVADPTGKPHMVQEGDTVATQYLFTQKYDLSLVLPTVKLWDVKPPPPPHGTVTVEVTVPSLQLGDSDPINSKESVHRLQGLLRGVGIAWNNSVMTITIDGSFGPATDAAVREFQGKFGIGVSGFVGADTWTALIEG